VPGLALCIVKLWMPAVQVRRAQPHGAAAQGQPVSTISVLLQILAWSLPIKHLSKGIYGIQGRQTAPLVTSS
jgi:hypothetical protein